MSSFIPRVAIVGTRGYPSYYGGFETAVRKLAPFLADAGWDVTVYCRPGQTRVDDHDRDPRVRCVATPGLDSNALSTLSYGFFAVLHCLIRRPHVALVMNVANGFWLPLLRLRGIRTVVNVDGIEWHRDKWSKSGKWMFKAGAWLTARFAHELIFDAEAIGDYWRRRLHRDGVFIPYGADEYPPILFREEFEPHQYALLVARFVPENSVPQFIEAARIIAESHDVVLVGSTSEGQELYQLASAANQHPRIHWLGHVSDDRRLFSLWQNAGAYFHGHTVGGTNPALVQAMALGTKIVARDTVYNREVLGVDGDFCSGDPSEIASKVLALIEKGPVSDSPLRHRAREVYNWAGVCRDYENVLSAQASASRRAPSTSSAR